jgi:hypothetical protein
MKNFKEIQDKIKETKKEIEKLEKMKQTSEIKYHISFNRNYSRLDDCTSFILEYYTPLKV